MDNSLAFSILLFKEIELLEKIPPLQKMIREAVIKREWTDYELLMQSLGEIGASFEILETERESLFKNIALDDESFYAWTARLPSKEREEITGLYRNLKMTTLQIRIANDSLMEYLKEAKTAVSGFLEKAYPSRRGKMYSREGTEREADMRSVVVNRSF